MKGNQKYMLLIVAVCVTVLVLIARMPSELNPTLRLTLLQSSEPVSTIVQKRKVAQKQQIDIDKVDFAQGDQLIHPVIGPLGLRQNFYLELDTQLEVKSDGIYRFFVTSDDGFRLTIDGKTVSEFLKDRDFSTTQAERFFRAGTYRLRLSYFQGGGPLGLKAEYSRKGSAEIRLIGESSEDVVFRLPD